ncbi:succinate dehydrogenase assembly factor 2 [Neisseriaceae bacterium B1]
MTQFNETEKRRIRFQTRRGLLELDIVLKRFMATEFQNLSDEELEIFVDILTLEDQEFLAQVNQVKPPKKPEFEPLLEKIRAA